MSNPAPTSSMSERATSPINSRLRALVRRCPSPLRPPSFNALVTSSFEAWSAGTMPKRMPVSAETPRANVRTR